MNSTALQAEKARKLVNHLKFLHRYLNDHANLMALGMEDAEQILDHTAIAIDIATSLETDIDQAGKKNRFVQVQCDQTDKVA